MRDGPRWTVSSIPPFPSRGKNIHLPSSAKLGAMRCAAAAAAGVGVGVGDVVLVPIFFLLGVFCSDWARR